MRIGILLYDPEDCGLYYLVELQHRLEEAGHVLTFSRKSLLSLGRTIGTAK